MAVAVDQLGHGFKPFARPPRCKLPSFTQLDEHKMLDFTQQSKLPPQYLEHSGNNNNNNNNNIHKSFSTPCLSHSSQVKKDEHDHYEAKSRKIEIIVGRSAPRVRALVVEVAIAMAAGADPEPASSGLGGAYFLRAQNGDTIAVAKPIDEEPLAFNNPKGLAGRNFGQPGMKCSIRIGETGLRESAAYFLDHDNFAGVPPTALVRFSHVKFNLNNNNNNSGSEPGSVYKVASLQRFVKHDSDAGDLGPSSFSVTSVHHIGILDVRLMNLDRHAGNILVRQGVGSYGGGTAELVPIDHGFCLPESLEDPYFEWLHWPQASIPFSESEVDYILCLDPFKDAELLRSELPSLGESSVRVLVLCTIFLKEATSYGLCLSDIGEMMTREFHGGEGNWSTLESLCNNAKAAFLKNDDSDDETHLVEVDDEMFQFDDDLTNQESTKNSPSKGKPSKIPRYSSMSVLDGSGAGASPLSKNEKCLIYDCATKTLSDNNNNNNNNNCGDEDDDGMKGGGMMRSMSYSIQNYSRDGQCVCLGELNEEEWRMFLENFEKLLPEAFEERKSMGLSKQRLGSSCEF